MLLDEVMQSEEYKSLMDSIPIYKKESMGLKAVLSMLDIEHSIYVSDDIGLIGEFAGKEPKNLGNKLLDATENSVKRGDYFEVVNGDGEIIISEKVTHTFIFKDNRYMFIIKDKSVTRKANETDEVFDFIFEKSDREFEIVPAVVIYDPKTDSRVTNCKELGYTYNDSIVIDERFDNYEVYYNNDKYLSYKINPKNNIYNLYHVSELRD